MRLRLRESATFQFVVLLLLEVLVCGVVRADTIDYAGDAVLGGPGVNTGADSLSLAEILTLVEEQTELKCVVFGVEQLPLGESVRISRHGRMPLAYLLSEASAQLAVTFKRRANFLEVRESRGSDQFVRMRLPAGGREMGDAEPARLEPSGDGVLAGTMVNVTAESLPLSELISIVEAQSELRFAYEPEQLPMDAMVEIRTRGRVPVSRLLADATSQLGVHFKRHTTLVAVFPESPAEIAAGSSAIEAASVASAPNVAANSSGSDDAREAAGEATIRQDLSRFETADTSSSGESQLAGLPAGMSDVIQMEAFSVQGHETKGSAGDLKSLRTKAAVSVDYMTAAQLSKFSASDLADAVYRMPGISVADGEFAVVRGLSDRFLSTTLNGLKLPSPDPEKQAFQLDLIPTSAVEAVVVSKSFEPSLWAESTGGAMDIRTRTIPEQRYTSAGVGIRVNDNLFDSRLGYATRGNGFDERFGRGSGARLDVGEIDSAWQYVPTQRGTVPLGTKFSVEHSNLIPVGGGQLIGVLLSLANSSKHTSETGVYSDRRPLIAVAGPGGHPSDFETDDPYPQQVQRISDYTSSSSEFTTSASARLGYKISDNHAFEFSTLWVQTGDDESHLDELATTTDDDGVTTFVGRPNSNFPDLVLLRANEYFRERNLTLFQLAGEHKFLGFGDPEVTWALQRGRATQLDHPFSEAAFATPLDDFHKSYLVIGGNSAPTNPLMLIWATNEEKQTAARADSKWMFDIGRLQGVAISIGAAWEKSERERSGTTLIYQKPETGSNITGLTPNEAVGKGAEFVSSTRFGTDSYVSAASAAREIKGAYVQAALPIPGRITLSGGARIEEFEIDSSGSDKWAGTFTTHYLYATKESDATAGGYGEFLGTNGDDTPPFSSRKWYPGAAAKWEILESLSLRLAYSKTDGRPSFREVGPYFNRSVASGNLVVGNPALKPSEAGNLDARLEWQPGRNNFVSVSYFEKTISNPIEKFTLNTRPTISVPTEVFINNPGDADLSGFEVEIRHGLATWTDALRDFSIGANFTHIDAEVPEHPIAMQTASVFFLDPDKVPATRRLYDQPEYIANLDFTWERPEWGSRVTLAAYAVSDTLESARLSSFNFDVYDRAHVSWDLIFRQVLPRGLKLNFSVKNLTDPVRGTVNDRDKTTGTVPVREYHAGRDYSLSLEASF